MFFTDPMPTPVAVTQSMQQLGLNFTITDHQSGFDAVGGFMPISYGKGADALDVGVEVYVGSARDRVDAHGIGGVDPDFFSLERRRDGRRLR